MLKSDNLISRAAAIEAVHNEFDGCLVWDESGEATANEVERIIASLPSEAPDGPDNLVKDSQGLVKDLVNDCISRKAAIDLLKQMRKDGNMIPWEGKDVFARIWKLPSAQPEKRTNERTETHACDLISREAAIEAVHDEFDGCLVWDESGEATANEVERIIASLPSAQPDEEKVSNILYNIYRNTSPHTSAEGVAAAKYYIREIYHEIFGEEGPRWMKK